MQLENLRRGWGSYLLHFRVIEGVVLKVGVEWLELLTRKMRTGNE